MHLDVTISCDRKEVLETLKANKARHVVLVEKAKEGYLKAAKEALENKEKEIKEGKVVPLSFDIHPPQDYSSTYDKAIKMMEMHSSDNIDLKSSEFQQLVCDEWNWSNSFLVSNSGYAPEVYSPLFEGKGLTLP